MSKGYLLSILFHLAVFLLLIININILKPPKKLTYQKFSIHIGPVKKEPSTNLPKDSPEKKITKEIPEIPQKKEIVQPANSKTPEKKITKEVPEKEDKKKPVIKKNNAIKEIVKEPPAIEKKKVNKKELQKTNTQKLQQEKKQKIPKKDAIDTKKLPDLTKEKKVAKQEPVKDIFSNVADNSEPVNLNNTYAVLDENDRLRIQEQLQKHWNSTPCLEGMQTEVEIILDGNCNIIHRALKNAYTSSAQLRACAESALKSTQKIDKIELDEAKSCKKYNQELIKIYFNK
ncbi:hypothetical protein [Candidatus Bandiella numerosa]|uniref:hypothetical protein n=1 Tax=Candidatus Bandiella numerosa TaxID=2570586 RepID=UPI001F2740A2|nr:hypothetical protein [Candidatus Bandiella numerosa]